ncbi:MAG: tRNA uridine-5-carboxymethylaminomethyl(34) synthesis enzyme MnmG, partial [Syntrophomonadaceae bacterium]|nr:tRNA uridine-5-carboxymethylaminomethyl(34) synthesis enzyme MnmG [Syntrophomonadaceae bacterium]
IGGPAKAQLVREIDALGGEMGINVDKSSIQMRMINTSKGPAVQALRAQIDKHEYRKEMIKTIFAQESLDLLMAEVEEIEEQKGKIKAIRTRTGARYECEAVVVTTGTYLKGRIIAGEVMHDGGPDNQFPAVKLAENLRSMGIKLGRFKTGTPPRIDRKSVDFSRTIEQPGDDKLEKFSFIGPPPQREQLSCWLTHSTTETHRLVMDNIDRAPMFNGVITGKGPRYCPSFEAKVMEFAHKTSHQLFIEPEGRDTDEMYVQGLNTSLPEDVQIQVLKSIPGLENVQMVRTGYAIEYDYVIASQTKLSMESKIIDGLFTAGQINGTSGYEEAAAQGLMAGINAALKIQKKEPFELKRSEAFIGVMIDDLITKESDEPYRLLTSRAEYRLLLRQDNADLRLTEKGREIGLIDDKRWALFQAKRKALQKGRQALQETTFTPSDAAMALYLREIKGAALNDRISLWELLRRPEVKINDFIAKGWISDMNSEICDQLEIQTKYEGYIKKQRDQVQRFEKMENKEIPEDIDYDQVYSLSNEGINKLKEIRPQSLGQAMRIGGVSPADVNSLLIFLAKEGINK